MVMVAQALEAQKIISYILKISEAFKRSIIKASLSWIFLDASYELLN